MKVNQDNKIKNAKDVDKELTAKLARQRDRAAIEAWATFEEDDPESAEYIKEHYSEMGYKKVILRSTSGDVRESYVPLRKSEDELHYAAERRVRYYDRPTPEEYLASERADGSTESDDDILERYVDIFYDLES